MGVLLDKAPRRPTAGAGPYPAPVFGDVFAAAFGPSSGLSLWASSPVCREVSPRLFLAGVRTGEGGPVRAPAEIARKTHGVRAIPSRGLPASLAGGGVGWGKGALSEDRLGLAAFEAHPGSHPTPAPPIPVPKGRGAALGVGEGGAFEGAIRAGPDDAADLRSRRGRSRAPRASRKAGERKRAGFRGRRGDRMGHGCGYAARTRGAKGRGECAHPRPGDPRDVAHYALFPPRPANALIAFASAAVTVPPTNAPIAFGRGFGEGEARARRGCEAVGPSAFAPDECAKSIRTGALGGPDESAARWWGPQISTNVDLGGGPGGPGGPRPCPMGAGPPLHLGLCRVTGGTRFSGPA